MRPVDREGLPGLSADLDWGPWESYKRCGVEL